MAHEETSSSVLDLGWWIWLMVLWVKGSPQRGPLFSLWFFLTYLLTFFLTYLLTFFLTYLWTWHSGWGPVRYTGLTGSRLRSGAEHWPHRLAVEVRRGTLNSQDRGWGPVRNTGLTGSRLRSGAEHWPHIIARRDKGEREGEGEGEGGGQGWHKI